MITTNNEHINWDIENLNEQLDKNLYFEGKKFKAPLLAGDIIYHDFSLSPDHKDHINRGWLVTNDNQTIFVYNGKYYQDNGEEIIRAITQLVLGANCLNHYKDEVVTWIRDDLGIRIDRNRLNSNINLIGFENGVLDITTGEFDIHRHEQLLTSIVPYDYKPDAQCPTWLQFLDDVLFEQDVDFIQEMVGYCFYRKNIHAILVLLLGFGRNGKTTFINTVTRLLGEDNVEHIPLQLLCKDMVAKARIYNKMANLCSDLPSDSIRNTSVIKELTGGDYTYARQLYKDGFNFISYCKMIFAGNILPDCKDKTFAMKERFAVIEFVNTFPRDDPKTNPYLLDTLTEELSGIFNWALIGLKRLLENKKFSAYRDLEDVSKYHADQTDPVVMFIARFIRGDTENKIKKDVVYQTYRRYCIDELKAPTLASNHFSTEFANKIPTDINLSSGQSKGDRVWVGIQCYDTIFEQPDENGQVRLDTTEKPTGEQQEEENDGI